MFKKGDVVRRIKEVDSFNRTILNFYKYKSVPTTFVVEKDMIDKKGSIYLEGAGGWIAAYFELVTSKNTKKIGDTIINSTGTITRKILYLDEKGALVDTTDSKDITSRKWLNTKILDSYTVVIPDAWVRVTYKDRHRNSFQIGSKTYLSAEEATKDGDTTLLAGVVKLENYQQRAV